MKRSFSLLHSLLLFLSPPTNDEETNQKLTGDETGGGVQNGSLIDFIKVNEKLIRCKQSSMPFNRLLRS